MVQAFSLAGEAQRVPPRAVKCAPAGPLPPSPSRGCGACRDVGLHVRLRQRGRRGHDCHGLGTVWHLVRWLACASRGQPLAGRPHSQLSCPALPRWSPGVWPAPAALPWPLQQLTRVRPDVRIC